jgi:hypothetical protein
MDRTPSVMGLMKGELVSGPEGSTARGANWGRMIQNINGPQPVAHRAWPAAAAVLAQGFEGRIMCRLTARRRGNVTKATRRVVTVNKSTAWEPLGATFRAAENSN